MSVTRLAEMTCAVCSADSTHEIVVSSSGIGIDLDGRWHGPARKDRMGWPLRCPECGYSFFNLEVEPPEGVLDSEAYRAYAEDTTLADDARLWLLTSVVAEALDAPGAASHAALQAAWVMDDVPDAKRASDFRARAVELLQTALDTDGAVPSPKTAPLAVLADMLRRLGRLDEASRTVQEAREHPQDDHSALLLDGQEYYIAAEDTDAHAIETGVQVF